MTKQTAVEWLANQILDNWNDINAGAKNIMEFLEQAKEMERFRIENAYNDGAYDSKQNQYKGMHEYYNETYGGNNGKN